MWLSEDCKDRSDRDQTVNVGGPIQRIKCDNVFSLLVSLHLYLIIIFFRHKKAGGEGRPQHVDKEIIGKNIKFLNLFTLNRTIIIL